MIIKPCSIRFANDFVKKLHRHHKPVQGAKFAIQLQNEEITIGVAIVGRPVARKLDNGTTAEITRVCTDGTFNACSMLLGACRRICKEMGYTKTITYTLQQESGASLKGAGFKFEKIAGGGNWNVTSRKRSDTQIQEKKLLWCA